MAFLIPRFNWGSEIKNDNPTLYNQLNDSYTDIANAVNVRVGRVISNVNPVADVAANANSNIGDIWVNQAMNSAWIMTSRTTNTVVTWTLIT